ncbi:MAG: pseudouridine synthase [Chloroflexota bacterium]|nr:pseudouridine synthase [Chloroflexota bacterium]
MIRAGRVSVDGETVTELGTKVDPVHAKIRVDGRLLRAQRPRSIILNKPSGYITTTSDERGRWTVMDLVDVPERVYPVGRLDRDTEGLLLFTNDGDIANRVMHPRYGLDKEYHVLTLTRPDDRTLARVREGITVDGRRIVPEEFRILRETREGLILRIVIHEGLYHVVRRMMDVAGIPVERLRRVRLGPLSLEGIPKGTWRDLTAGELSQLHQALRLDRDDVEDAAEAPVGRRAQRRRAMTAAAGRNGEQTGPGESRERVSPVRPAQRPTPPWRRSPSAAPGERPDRGGRQSAEERRSPHRPSNPRPAAGRGRPPESTDRLDSGNRKEQDGVPPMDRRGGGAPSRGHRDARRSDAESQTDRPSHREEPPGNRRRMRRKGEPPAPAPRRRDDRGSRREGPPQGRRQAAPPARDHRSSGPGPSWGSGAPRSRPPRTPTKGGHGTHRGVGGGRPRRDVDDQERPGQQREFDRDNQSEQEAGPPLGRRHRRPRRGGQDDRGPAARRSPRRDPV